MKAGLTGHQDLGGASSIAWVTKALRQQISVLNITHGITCLAIGADQLYAEILLQKNIAFTVVLPCRAYEETFETKYRDRYVDLLRSAERVIKMNYDQPSERAFLDAGKEVVDRSEIVLAIWNGKKAKGMGGTADIVKYAAGENKKIVHINPVTHFIKEK